MYMHIVYIQYTLCEVLNEVPTISSGFNRCTCLYSLQALQGTHWLGTKACSSVPRTETMTCSQVVVPSNSKEPGGTRSATTPIWTGCTTKAGTMHRLPMGSTGEVGKVSTTQLWNPRCESGLSNSRELQQRGKESRVLVVERGIMYWMGYAGIK